MCLHLFGAPPHISDVYELLVAPPKKTQNCCDVSRAAVLFLWCYCSVLLAGEQLAQFLLEGVKTCMHACIKACVQTLLTA